ncbi:hypothetical protein EG329_006497 [Mollisiaceae sp. DMI_Dod_QoI]|nr:hypothetical protein EG329_006497 [Helotiales sp. DMI_Dod_QoI]
MRTLVLTVGSFLNKYPSRLIDLGEATQNDRAGSGEVRLVSTVGLLANGPVRDRFYMTLSHCWGTAQFVTLTEDNIEQFLNRGINIDSLPRTFRDAISFARRLSRQVRLAQATAAISSKQGLFFHRDPHKLWEEDINVNVEGIPGKSQPWRQRLDSVLDYWDSAGATAAEPEERRIERCRILDVSFWTRYVDDAPVNTRGWVFQERLIALAGIAQMMYDEIKDIYVAGMWRSCLESQLLWSIHTVYEDGRFHCKSERPTSYRAPTFSWAAVDDPHGINYGQISDKGLLIEVIEVDIVPLSEENRFGLLKSGLLKLRGVVNKIELTKSPMNNYAWFAWHLITKAKEWSGSHRNVYLDSPTSDKDIFGKSGRVYCLPARRDSAGYLICLLLQLERRDGVDTGSYTRIGLTKIAPYEEGQEKMLEFSTEDEPIPHADWDAIHRKHTIQIV